MHTPTYTLHALALADTGMSRAVNDMLVSAIGGRKGYVQVFPLWPAAERASFSTLLVKGGFAVSASYDNVTAVVSSPIIIRVAYSLGASSVCRVADPWGGGPTGGLTVACGGSAVPVSWESDGFIFSFTAPLGVDCSVVK